MSNEIICPICKEIVLIQIHDYKIDLNECKDGHKLNNILINEFENNQMIDISKIICDECKLIIKVKHIIMKCINVYHVEKMYALYAD